MQRPPQNAGFADSGGVYAALCSPLFVQADLVGDHRDELTIRGFAAEVAKRVISSFILCSFSILSLNRAINFMVLVGSLSIIYCAHIILQKSPSGKALRFKNCHSNPLFLHFIILLPSFFMST